MKADQVVAHCKNALNRKNLFVPSEVHSTLSTAVSTFNTVQNVDCTYVDGGDFYEWAPLLQQYFKNLPGGFTGNYVFEFADGKVTYKKLVSSSDDTAETHVFCADTESTKAALLRDLFNLPASASLLDIANAKLRLPTLKPKPLPQSKLDSLSKKVSAIPDEFRWFYPEPKSSKSTTTGKQPTETGDHDIDMTKSGPGVLAQGDPRRPGLRLDSNLF